MSYQVKFNKFKKVIDKDLEDKFNDNPSFDELKDQIDYVKRKVLKLDINDDNDEIRLRIYDPILQTLENNLYSYEEYENEVYGLCDNFEEGSGRKSFYSYKGDF